MAETKTKDEAKTKKAVVASDGLGYKLPGQDKPGARETYVTLSANRGDDIELDVEDYERFVTLGHVVDPGTPEAAAAKSPRLPGQPYGAVRVASENENLPVQKLRAKAIEVGAATPADFGDDFAREHAELAASFDDGSATAVSGEAPGDDELPLDDAKKLGKALNVTQIKNLAARHGVRVEDGDTKAAMAGKIVKAHKASSGS